MKSYNLVNVQKKYIIACIKYGQKTKQNVKLKKFSNSTLVQGITDVEHHIIIN